MHQSLTLSMEYILFSRGVSAFPNVRSGEVGTLIKTLYTCLRRVLADAFWKRVLRRVTGCMRLNVLASAFESILRVLFILIVFIVK
jgi:hypothetical protein